jgi:hypothetical protein
MSLFELKQEDINDLLTLISVQSLTITANNARRVVQLQDALRNAKPSTLLDECKARCEALEVEVQECLRKRDGALLEAGLAKSREAKQIESMAQLEQCARGECDPSTCSSMRHQL